MAGIRRLGTISVALVLAGGIAAWTRPPETTARSKVTATPAPSSLQSFAFLEGCWRGEMNGAMVEEVWSPPHGNSLMGVFRWCSTEGTPKMFEMLTITQEADVTRLRLRHYSATLNAKEDADKPLSLTLAKGSTPTKVTFEAESAGDLASVVYAREADTLHITVTFKPTPAKGDQPEKSRSPLVFTLNRT